VTSQAKRSEFVPRGCWNDLFDYLEDDPLYSVGENATVRFENITFTAGGHETNEMTTFGIGKGVNSIFFDLVWFGLVYLFVCLFVCLIKRVLLIKFSHDEGATVYFQNCQFIGCSFYLTDNATVYASKCLFTQRKRTSLYFSSLSLFTPCSLMCIASCVAFLC
jgi:hypothetical protein